MEKKNPNHHPKKMNIKWVKERKREKKIKQSEIHIHFRQ